MDEHAGEDKDAMLPGADAVCIHVRYELVVSKRFAVQTLRFLELSSSFPKYRSHDIHIWSVDLLIYGHPSWI